MAVFVELARSAVQAQRDLLARGVTGLVDCFENQLDRRFMAGQARRKTAFVADRRAHAAVVDDFLQRMEDFGAIADRFTEGRRTDRDDHQFLQVEAVVGMRAAVDHIHHRHRQLHRA